jgi:hypothetical protein
MVEQGLMYFIFQKDLGVQLQRALNMERYEIATKIRERRQRVSSRALCLSCFILYGCLKLGITGKCAVSSATGTMQHCSAIEIRKSV